MIELIEHEDGREVQYTGTVKTITADLLAILEGYRHTVGIELTLKVIEHYLTTLEDEIKETK